MDQDRPLVRGLRPVVEDRRPVRRFGAIRWLSSTVRLTLPLILVLLMVPSAYGQSERASRVSVSLGGGDLVLVSVTGSGIEGDPVTIVERLDSLAESTLVIRYDPSGADGAHQTVVRPSMHLTFTLVVTNGTGRAWSGFRLDLQAEAGRPSTYFDGLSFDQPGLFPNRPAASDNFDMVRRNIEPFDGLHYYRGGVDPGETVRLFFNITDMNVKQEFYLIQQPEFLSAGLRPGLARASHRLVERHRADVHRR